MTWNFCISAAALANALGVVGGAFGSHFFKTRLSIEDLLIYETAIRYLFINTIGLFIVGFLLMRVISTELKIAGWLFIAGIIIFCGSLFLLIITKTPALGAITPVGGLCFILAWLLLARAAYRCT